MDTSTSAPVTDTPRLPADLTLGPVHLTVRDLPRAVAFYDRSLALTTRERSDDHAALGVDGRDLVVLHASPDAPDGHRHAGLFHMALLYPTRSELGRALTRLAVTRTPIQGAADHGVSEAVYLADPEGNGIELYVDRPRGDWPPPGRPGERMGMVTEALDLADLLAAAPADGHGVPATPDLRMGHVHLHVADLSATRDFYTRVLGMDLMQTYPGALFLSAGGYHHHVGANTWRGVGVPPAPDGAAGLRQWTMVVPDPAARTDLEARLRAHGDVTEATAGGLLTRDPSGNPILVTDRS